MSYLDQRSLNGWGPLRHEWQASGQDVFVVGGPHVFSVMAGLCGAPLSHGSAGSDDGPARLSHVLHLFCTFRWIRVMILSLTQMSVNVNTEF